MRLLPACSARLIVSAEVQLAQSNAQIHKRSNRQVYNGHADRVGGSRAGGADRWSARPDLGLGRMARWGDPVSMPWFVDLSLSFPHNV